MACFDPGWFPLHHPLPTIGVMPIRTTTTMNRTRRHSARGEVAARSASARRAWAKDATVITIRMVARLRPRDNVHNDRLCTRFAPLILTPRDLFFRRRRRALAIGDDKEARGVALDEEPQQLRITLTRQLLL